MHPSSETTIPIEEFDSFRAFVYAQNLEDKHVRIKCDGFDGSDLPSYFETEKLKVKSIEIICDRFNAANMLSIAPYIDDAHKPKITIKTKEPFFYNNNSFSLLANIGKKVTINLISPDNKSDLFRNVDYQLYFANPESAQYRKDLSILMSDQRIPYLRHNPSVSTRFGYTI